MKKATLPITIGMSGFCGPTRSTPFLPFKHLCNGYTDCYTAIGNTLKTPNFHNQLF